MPSGALTAAPPAGAGRTLSTTSARSRQTQRRSLRRDILTCAGLAATYVLAGKFGLALALVNPSATVVWPPAGIALAAALIFGPRVWPGIFVGAFLTNELTAGSHATSVFLGIGNTLEAVLGAYLINRVAGGRHAFDHGRDIVAFVWVVALASTVAATVGVTSLWIAGFAVAADYSAIWLTWWVGDAVGAIVVAPLILLWHENLRVHWSDAQRIELLLMTLALVTVGWVVFVLAPYPLTFLCVPLSVWAGTRFGQREAATATCVLSMLAIWGSTQGLGAFADASATSSLPVAAFMAVTAVVGLSVGAAESGKRRAEERLYQANCALESRVLERTGELQSAVDQLRVSESRLAEAQEVARIGGWEFNVPENRVWWSDELYRMYGVDPASFRPSYDAFLALVHPDDRSMVHRIISESLGNAHPFDFEHRIVHAGGQVPIMLAKGRAVRGDDGQVVRLLGTAQDITERKGLEGHLRQAQKMEAVGILASGVAHDFNNLLTAISGYTDLVLESLGDSPQRADLQEVLKATGRAGALTRQLLAFSRKQVLQLKVLDVNVLVANIGKLLARTIPESIELVLDLDPVLEAVKADATHLEQVLLNLAVNARDAMPHGGQLRLATKVVDVDRLWAQQYPPMTAGRYVRLVVSDTGTGMTPATQAHIFEPFFTTKGEGQGTGLGLSTAYGIVKQSDGFIWVTSELGRGTGFEIYLPVVHAPLDSLAAIDARPLVGGSETILFAEDDGAVRRLARHVLTSYGYSVLDARDGEEALAIAARHNGTIDLLVADVIMPGLSGPDLAERLTRTIPGMKVLYTSGYAESATRRLGVKEGLSLLSKPFLPGDLLHKVRETLEQ
jgi:PAS domain S-box-containing protein